LNHDTAGERIAALETSQVAQDREIVALRAADTALEGRVRATESAISQGRGALSAWVFLATIAATLLGGVLNHWLWK